MERKTNESFLEYARRVTTACGDKLITYSEWGDLLLGSSNCYSSDNLRKSYYFVSKLLDKIDSSVAINSDELKHELESLKWEIIKERKKLQTINLEYNSNARNEGRYELFLEMVVDSISRLKPIEIKPFVPTEHIDLDTTGVLFLSDAHYGKEFVLKGLYDEIVNQYSPTEFKNRMWKLLSDLENDNYNLTVNHMIVADLGDAIEGILRATSSLQKLKVGVLDSAIEYAEFIAVWLNELSTRLNVDVTYSIVGGNHDCCRILGNKADFPEENIGKIVQKIIKLRLQNNPQITIKDYSDVEYYNIYDYNMMVCHGDEKNLKETITFMENYYKIEIDSIVTGHLHRGSQETIGYGLLGDKEIIRVPSICGVDDYAKSIRKCSRAGCQYMIFNKNGKQWQKIFYLN